MGWCLWGSGVGSGGGVNPPSPPFSTAVFGPQSLKFEYILPCILRFSPHPKSRLAGVLLTHDAAVSSGVLGGRLVRFLP